MKFFWGIDGYFALSCLHYKGVLVLAVSAKLHYLTNFIYKNNSTNFILIRIV